MAKTIALKLPDEDHKQVKEACRIDGKRSISSLARSAIMAKTREVLANAEAE